ncbi:hypothetical protein [Halotalea alkalilenta]|uniref:hypothetical protein n=1 Tax=Halotalea alkalilenta TaxID=376489 RepID=UPI0012DBE171|nr:hypothetical protein [Halotalea alkalilenta]
MKKLNFGVEYMATPFFCPDTDSMGHVDIEDLELSAQLGKNIYEWDKHYQESLNQNYPPDSIFEKVDEHNIEGERLFNEIKKEVGEKYDIIFHPLKKR